jgi:hypothetical protein
MKPLGEEMSRAAREYALTRRWADALQPLYETYRESAATARLASTTSADLRSAVTRFR